MEDASDNADVMDLPANGVSEEEEVEEDTPKLEDLTFSFTHCKKCLYPLCEPVSTSCGHNFCLSCLKNMAATWAASKINDQQKMLCPVCSTSIRSMFAGPGGTLTPTVAPNMLLSAAVCVVESLLNENRQSDDLFQILIDKMGTAPRKDDASAFAEIVEKISELSVTEADIIRCKKDIEERQRVLDNAIAMRTILTKGMRICSLFDATVLSPHEKCMLVNNTLRREARNDFVGLPQEIYNAILVKTTPDMFSNPDKFQKLMRLPIIGLAAASTVVIVECTCNNVMQVCNDLFTSPYWCVQYGSQFGVWFEDVKPGSKKSLGLSVGHIFVAGTISIAINGVCVLKERHKQGKMLWARAPPMTSDLPASIYTNIATYLGPSYCVRCVLGPTRTMQAGWDSIIPQSMLSE